MRLASLQTNCAVPSFQKGPNEVMPTELPCSQPAGPAVTSPIHPSETFYRVARYTSKAMPWQAGLQMEKGGTYSEGCCKERPRTEKPFPLRTHTTDRSTAVTGQNISATCRARLVSMPVACTVQSPHKKPIC